MADGGGGGGGGEGPPIFFLDSGPINSQEWKKRKAKRGFFLHVADKNALHPGRRLSWLAASFSEHKHRQHLSESPRQRDVRGSHRSRVTFQPAAGGGGGSRSTGLSAGDN